MDPKSPGYNPRHVGAMGTYVASIDHVDKIDDFTIAITTKKPYSLFPNEMAMYYMISNCAVEKAGNDYTAYMQHPVGTGPYKFDKVVPHERLELNPRRANAGTRRRDPEARSPRASAYAPGGCDTRRSARFQAGTNFVEATA